MTGKVLSARPQRLEAETDAGLYEAFAANFEVLTASSSDLIDEALALRFQVYCMERGYEDRNQHSDGRERDEFDVRSVHAVVRHRATGCCAGAVRLVLADRVNPLRPFPIEMHCGEHFYPSVGERVHALPRHKVAEISRFAVSKDFRRRLSEGDFTHGLSPDVPYTDTFDKETQRGRVMPQVTIGLFAAIVELSVREGIQHWFAVMEPTLLRLLVRFGIHFPPIGPVVDYHGRRRPTLGTAADVLSGIRRQRPDVWAIVTDRGRLLPR